MSPLPPSTETVGGILNNEMYIGKLTWNRPRSAGKRHARPNPQCAPCSGQ
ncbi:hypothetical protein G6L24_28465 [Agrobacterium tumefaciens]|nr:hypothetical protein [Agrobacterium tumefaciens]UXT00408.1 hypothetical protein FY143_26870 [Agrobacterium tumefaciens]